MKLRGRVQRLPGEYHQEFGVSEGSIAREIIGELTRPYFYAVFVLNGTDVAFNKLEEKELKNTKIGIFKNYKE